MNFPKPLTDILAIDYPIIQAPMSGQIISAELVAAVSNAGGLGSIPAGFMTPQELEEMIIRVKALTDKPFQVNLFIAKEPLISYEEITENFAVLVDMLGDQQEPISFHELPTTGWQFSPLHELLPVILAHDVPIVSFSFGTPDREMIQDLKDHGLIIIGTVTHLLEAFLWQDLGADALILQGNEAGGYRATFIGNPPAVAQSTSVLIKQIKGQINLPVIAAGGIMDAGMIGAAFCLGADGVALGTAFITAHESTASTQHKEALIHSNELDSTMSNLWSGIYARGLKNDGFRQLKSTNKRALPFPIQAYVIEQALKQTEHAADPKFTTIFAGVGAQFCQNLSVQSLMEQWIDGIRKL